MTRHINQLGLDIIKRFETLRLTAYADPIGIPTIGYGHTRGVKLGDTITEEHANMFLADDLQDAESHIEQMINIDININQFSAMVCLVFNIGWSDFAKSTIRRLVNDGDFDGAAGEFCKWNHAGGQQLPGLTRRRQAEEELFRRPALKPLSQSRTIAGTSIAGTATVASVAGQLNDATSTLSGLAPYYKWAGIALGVLAILGVAYAAWARYDDHRQGVR